MVLSPWSLVLGLLKIIRNDGIPADLSLATGTIVTAFATASHGTDKSSPKVEKDDENNSVDN
jgi:hypothetical protein